MGTTPTFSARRQGCDYTSIVDVTLVSERLAGLVEGWMVDPSMTDLSDYRPIRFEVSSRIYDTRKVNWASFDERLERALEEKGVTGAGVVEMATAEDLERGAVSLTEAIAEACEVIPRIARDRKVQAAKWWAPKLAELKSGLNRWRARLRASAPRRREAVYLEYQEAKTDYKTAVQTAILASWRKFCGEQDRRTLWQGVYRIIKNCGEHKGDQLLKDPNTGSVLPPQESADLLADTFYPPDLPSEDTAAQAQLRATASSTVAAMRSLPPQDCQLFTLDELEGVLKGMNPRKAPGVDLPQT